MLRNLSLATFVIVFAAPITFAQHDPMRDVNLRIGTAADGQTYPAIGMPFGMTHWTPETRPGEVKCIAPYYDSDRRLTGFRGTHFISGSCVRDYGSFTLMPESGRLRLLGKERASAFEHASEQMSPAKYSVRLPEEKIEATIAGLSRSGLFQFRFERNESAWFVVQNNASLPTGWTSIDLKLKEVTGEVPVRRLYAGNGKPAGFSCYFVIQFDHELMAQGSWSAQSRHADVPRQATTSGESGVYIGFKAKAGDVVHARIGTSFVSLDEARENLKGEIDTWNVDDIANRSEAEWRKLLHSVDVTTPSDDRRAIFYTALYHASLQPRTFSDLDGSYPSFGGNVRTEHAAGFVYYDDFSIWDTFRAVHPWVLLSAPDREKDMVRSLVEKGRQGGYLPIFPAWNSYTSEMVGDHAIAIIADAYVKGLRGFDADAAFELARKNATSLPTSYAQYVDGRGRRALKSYLRYGFIPLEDPVAEAFHQKEQVSRTLEYAYDDFLVGTMAAALGRDSDAEVFRKRSANWRNVFDSSTSFVRGRYENGNWVTPFEPYKEVSWITEGLPAQYSFFVPQDIPGLIEAMGGRGNFVSKLDDLFRLGAYNHGNEPSHHIAYLYDQADAAWKTQEHVYQIMTQQYGNGPGGLMGNDDSGQISAWFLFSSIGFYPVTPGTPIYWIGSPFFDKAVLHVPSGKNFTVVAKGAGEGKHFISSATLNGKSLNRCWLNHSEIEAGGELVFEMSSNPVDRWPQGAGR